MIGTDPLAAGCALFVAVAGGLVAHELSHALALELARVDYTVSYFPDRTDGVLAMLASCPWAAVHPRPTGNESAWILRLAAMMPLVLALPVLVLGVTGSLPTEHVAGTAFVIGWLACTIPSPQDFSVAFYAHRALEEVHGATAARTP